MKYKQIFRGVFPVLIFLEPRKIFFTKMYRRIIAILTRREFIGRVRIVKYYRN